MKHQHAFFLVVVLSLAVLGWAQAQKQPTAPPTPPSPVVSPDVRPDGSVTFRFRAPNVKEVALILEGAPPAPMQKDEAGVWSMTTTALAPDIYGYSFIVDGVGLIDPSNWRLKPNLINNQSAVYVPGPASLPWEINDVPHGEIHHHFYHSKAADDDRDFYVYTPPGYDPLGKQTYPVLYLLHGFSDAANGWMAVGRANFILDNMIAQGKAKPMVVVTPLGYGTMEMVKHGWGVWSNTELRQRNFNGFREALLTEVMPRIESEYRVSKDREAHAIAGLSMGGSESLLTGLNNLDKFAWVGAFSSGGIPDDFQADFPALDIKANEKLKLLWIACGTEDRLIDVNRNLRNWLKSKGVQHTPIETPGAHTWMVWRRNLAEFAPLLFR